MRLNISLQQARSFHVARAQFITINEKGIPTPCETEIRIGDPHQAFIYIEPRFGDKIRSTVTQQTGLGNTPDLKKLPMVFHHSSRHFSHGAVPYPRLQIAQDLPRQTTSDTSPATLWTSFNWHALTLNGSPEGKCRPTRAG
ncbi:hypothetical protein N0V84_007841 [Fusarium piperis]|uniref:Uncharacterized protein n=1 Tax=Fusarium piperis TaxID=1435070 RepID=A0A9W8W9A6_9HYPO|nr:hypothetical protein N0V84_007841 [Fusarium piperis]